jgi:hypothetical protein
MLQFHLMGLTTQVLYAYLVFGVQVPVITLLPRLGLASSFSSWGRSLPDKKRTVWGFK